MKSDNIEKSFDRLEEIVKILEANESEIEKSVELYAEGCQLIGICSKKLEDIKTKVEILRGEDTIDGGHLL